MRRPVLVTGANSGIGLATVLHLARLGFPVVGSARTAAKAETIQRQAEAAGVPVDTVVLDVADSGSYENVVAGLDPWGVVNNAGYINLGAIEDVDMDSVRRQFETMVFGPMRIVALSLPAMRMRGEGRILNVISVAAHTTGPPVGWYSAVKHALAAATEALRIETWMSYALAAGRLAIGITAAARPHVVSRLLAGRAGENAPSAHVLTRALAVRDIALAVATLDVLRRRSPATPTLLLVGALCDGTDAALTARHGPMPPRTRRLGLAVATGAAIVGAWQALRLRGTVLARRDEILIHDGGDVLQAAPGE